MCIFRGCHLGYLLFDKKYVIRCMFLCFIAFSISAMSLYILASYFRVFLSPVCVCVDYKTSMALGVFYIEWGSVCAAIWCIVRIRSRIFGCVNVGFVHVQIVFVN
jgi:hypothetical protein